MSIQTIVCMKDIQMKFGKKTVLDHVSISIKEREIFGLLGPSGAGKTTIINILTGQLKPSAGTAMVLGCDVTRLSEKAYSKIGMVLDNCGLYQRLSCHDNLRVFADIHGLRNARIKEVLKEVGLHNEENTTVSKLSKGMTQRLALARAILNSPAVLFLDEPTSGLDPVTAKMIHDLISKICHDGTTVLLTTHNMNEATKLCSNVAFLNHGKIVAYGRPHDLRKKYYEEKKYTVEFSDGRNGVLSNDEDDDMEQLIYALRNNEIYTIHSTEPSLEEVFFKTTGRIQTK